MISVLKGLHSIVKQECVRYVCIGSLHMLQASFLVSFAPCTGRSPFHTVAALRSFLIAGEFDVPLRMFYPDGSSPSFRLRIVPQGKS